VVNVPSCSGPFIGYTNIPNLLVAVGHNCWGINNAPGTGKVMAELILEGKAKSAQLHGLEPTRHFEVSV
jgi:glycine/D-amino acid oxidase-like deaminating enzyme